MVIKKTFELEDDVVNTIVQIANLLEITEKETVETAIMHPKIFAVAKRIAEKSQSLGEEKLFK